LAAAVFNFIEHFFSKLKHFRRVATRYDKLAANFLAMVRLASMRLWLRAYESTAQAAGVGPGSAAHQARVACCTAPRGTMTQLPAK
jgi:hypothetical protein